MILRWIAQHRGRKAFEKTGEVDYMLNPYKPSIGNPNSRWTSWYEGHRRAYYKSINVDLNVLPPWDYML